jgi:hypothetical protein
MTDSTTRSASASIDPFHQKFDCLYDGDINACDKDCKQLGECKRRTPGKASPPSVAATGDEVWEVSSRTISCLFATEDAAKSFIATLPASVGGGMQVAKRFVLGAARSSRPMLDDLPWVLGLVNMPYTSEASGTRVVGVKIDSEAFAKWKGSDHPYMHEPIDWLRDRLTVSAIPQPVATVPAEELSQLYGLLIEERTEDAIAFIRRWVNGTDGTDAGRKA